MLQPRECKTFEQYAQKNFVPYIETMFKVVKRVDIVWDRYFPPNLKNSTPENRGEGIRRKVTDTGLLPKNWITFLRCSENKKELFPYLTKVANANYFTHLLSTSDKDVCCSKTLDMQGLSQYDHEDTDMRILVHVKHATNEHSRIMIKTIDTDRCCLHCHMCKTYS